MKDDALSQRALQNAGQGDYSAGVENDRGIYPAIVVPYGTNDNTEQNRIRVRIVALDDDGKIKGKTSSNNEENYNNYAGKDRGIYDEQLVLCIPLLPEFFHVRPQVGEMVFVIMENPKDNAGVRYWIGPIVSSKLKLKYQSYEDAVKIFNKTDIISNAKISSSLELSSIFPEDSDVAVQGRNDADLILKSRESLLVCGKLNENTLTVNTETPSFLRIKQINTTSATTQTQVTQNPTHNIDANIAQGSDGNFTGTIIVTDINTKFVLKDEKNSYSQKNFTTDWLNKKIKESKEKYKLWSFTTQSSELKGQPDSFKVAVAALAVLASNNKDLLQKYSQATLVSTNINIYSPRGKFRGEDIKNFEKNTDLKSFGGVADSLHPAIFGDESIRLFDIIIRMLLTHIHTPEMPPLQTALSDELKKYTVEGYLQNLLSNHFRIN